MADRDSSASPPRRRRSEDPRRKQDPERTRKQILRAAADEFGKFGFGDARVLRIAAAAGVSHQLITYHFGGKKGLYDALNERWRDRSEQVMDEDQSMVQVIRDYVQWAHEDEGWARTLAREAFDGGFPIGDERVAHLVELVEKTRMRQKRGEIDDSIDVGVLSLVLLAACMAPAVLPAFARAFIRMDPSSPDFVELYANQLSRMMAALGRPDQD